MKEKIEIQVILDAEGVKCVRIVGPPEEHKSGHELYFKLQDLIKDFSQAVQRRLKQGEEKDDESTNERFNA